MAKLAEAEKVDLYKLHKSEYAASKEPALVNIKAAKYLTVDGQGEPGGELFQAKLGALYAVAFTIKMTKKFAGKDYKVCGLEGLWTCDDPENWMEQARGTWRWKLMIRIPGFITAADLQNAVAKLETKGKGDHASEVRLETITEGKCVQVLHVGPYANEPATVARMQQFAEGRGQSFRGQHHEIYLSDPRRVPPERLRTILRHPVA